MPARREENRLRALERTSLLDAPPEAAFDRLTRLASRFLDAPVALVSLVDDRRQFFLSALGLGEPWASRRGTPLSHSFCQYVTRDRTALIVSDAREHPLVRDNLAIRDLNVVAYAGIPLIVSGEAIGAFCVVDDKPHEWSQEQIELLSDLAASVVAEIELRVAMQTLVEERALTSALIENLGDGVLAIDSSRNFVVVNAAARRMFKGAEVGTPLPPDWTTMHRSIGLDGTPLPPERGALGRALRGENTDGLTFTLQGPGAVEPIWVEASGRPVYSEKGQVIAAVAVYRDVSEKKRRADLFTCLAGNIPRANVILFDRSLRCLAIDGGMMRAGGSLPQDLVGRSMRELAGRAGEDKRFDRIEDAYRRTIAGQSLTIDFVDGERTLALHTAPVRGDLDHVWAGIVLTLDVTAERRTEASLRRSEQVYRAIVQNLPNGAVFMVDRDLRYVAADGPVVAEVLRRNNLEKLIGRSVPEVAGNNDNGTQIVDVFARALEGESNHVDVRRGDRYYEMNVVPIFDGEQPSHALGFVYDITNRKAELEELERARVVLEKNAHELREASVTDELTGLLNRRGFMLLAGQEMKAATRNQKTLALVFVDLNGMKSINDSLGHETGDRALIDAASILRRVFRSSDVIARLGGDEFVVLATDANVESAPVFVDRLKEALADYNAPRSSPFRLSMSAGTSIFDPANPSTLEKLMSDADARMYEAKQTRGLSTFPRVTFM